MKLRFVEREVEIELDGGCCAQTVKVLQCYEIILYANPPTGVWVDVPTVKEEK